MLFIYPGIIIIFFIMDKLKSFLNEMILNLGGGPGIIPLRYIINTTKGLTPIFIMTLMHFYQNFSLGAYLYVGNIDLI